MSGSKELIGNVTSPKKFIFLCFIRKNFNIWVLL